MKGVNLADFDDLKNVQLCQSVKAKARPGCVPAINIKLVEPFSTHRRYSPEESKEMPPDVNEDILEKSEEIKDKILEENGENQMGVVEQCEELTERNNEVPEDYEKSFRNINEPQEELEIKVNSVIDTELKKADENSMIFKRNSSENLSEIKNPSEKPDIKLTPIKSRKNSVRGEIRTKMSPELNKEVKLTTSYTEGSPLNIAKIRSMARSKIESCHIQNLLIINNNETNKDSLSIEAILNEATKNHRKPRLTTFLPNVQERKIDSRIAESVQILAKIRLGGEISGLSLFHSVLYSKPRHIESWLDYCKSDYERFCVVNSKDQFGRSPLHYACLLGDQGHIRLLLTSGANPFARDFRNRSPLHFSAYSNNETTQVLLLRACESFAQIKSSMLTNYNNFSVARLSIFHLSPIFTPSIYREPSKYPHVELNLSDFPQFVQEMIIMVNKSPDFTTEYIDAKRKYVDWTDDEGKTALHIAVERSKCSIVKALLALEADWSIEDIHGKSAIDIATTKSMSSLFLKDSKKNSVKAAKFLRSSSCFIPRNLHAITKEVIDSYFCDDENYLMNAVKNNDLTTITMLLSKECSISASNSIKYNPLFIGIKYNRLKAVKLLLNIDRISSSKEEVITDTLNALFAITNKGYNVLHICSRYSELSMFNYILSLMQEIENRMIFHKYPHVLRIQKLIDSPCRQKFTPFLLAVKHSKLEISKALVDLSCSIYSKNNKLQNALHLAVYTENEEIIKFILKLDLQKGILKRQTDINHRRPSDLDIFKRFRTIFVSKNIN